MQIRLSLVHLIRASDFYSGYLSDAAIYGAVLSADQAANHFNEGSVGTSSRPTYTSTVLSDSPVSYWQLHESSGATANDIAGSNNGTVASSGVSYAQPSLLPNDPSAKSMYFDGGTGHNITLPSGVQINSPLTVEMWVKPDTISSNEYLFSTGGYGIGINHGGGDSIHIDGATSGGSGYYNTANHLTAGNSYYIALTVDTSGNFTVHVGSAGSLSQWGSGNPGSGSVNYGSAADTIASYHDGSSAFKGNIGEVALYNSVLSTNQMTTDYLTGLTANPTADYLTATLGDGPSSAWRLNEASGTTANDIAGSNNGTIASSGISYTQPGLLAEPSASLYFDGGSGHNITLPSGVEISSPLTEEMWVKPDTISSDEYLFSTGGYGVGINHDNGDTIHVYGTTSGGSGSYDTANHLTAGNTYYIALTVDTSGNFTVYVGSDGKFSQWGAGNPGAGSIQYGSAANTIGSHYDGSMPYKGNIEEVDLYGSVLSPLQMANHYNAGLYPDDTTGTATNASITLGNATPDTSTTHTIAFKPGDTSDAVKYIQLQYVSTASGEVMPSGLAMSASPSVTVSNNGTNLSNSAAFLGGTATISLNTASALTASGSGVSIAIPSVTNPDSSPTFYVKVITEDANRSVLDYAVVSP